MFFREDVDIVWFLVTKSRHDDIYFLKKLVSIAMTDEVSAAPRSSVSARASRANRIESYRVAFRSQPPRGAGLSATILRSSFDEQAGEGTRTHVV